MKTIKTFSTFQTRFLHLANQAQIPKKDLLLDLFDKVTLNLQQAVLLVFTTIQTLKEFTDQYLAINQSLHLIKTHADWIKTKNLLNQAAGTAKTAYTALV